MNPNMPDLVKHKKTGEIRPCCIVYHGHSRIEIQVWCGHETEPHSLNPDEWEEYVEPFWPVMVKLVFGMIAFVSIFGFVILKYSSLSN